MQNSWLRRLCPHKKNYFFVSTAPVKDEPTALVPCIDTWVNLCCKTAQAIQALNKRMPDMLWYMKADDDTLLVPQNLVTELRFLDPDEPVVVGSPLFIVIRNQTVVTWGRSLVPWGTYPGEPFSLSENLMYPGGGSGYIWSRGLMKRFIHNMSLFYSICQKIIFEDVSIGLFTQKVGGRMLGNLGFRPWPPDVIEGPSREEFYKTFPISYHIWYDANTMPLYDHLIHQFLLPRWNTTSSQTFDEVLRHLNDTEKPHDVWFPWLRRNP
jgi:hypothetical protein